jgi:hypothetical protein
MNPIRARQLGYCSLALSLAMADRAGMLSANRSDPLNGRIGCVTDEKKGGDDRARSISLDRQQTLGRANR